MPDTTIRAFEGGIAKAVGDRQVRVIMSTPRVDRHGDIVEMSGVDLTEYRRNPVVLWQHDHDEPIARCAEVGIVGQRLEAVVQFPPEGTSEDADEAYRLVKAGVVSAVSVGFIPKEWSYLDEQKPWAGIRYRAVELIELSFVSVGANPDALVIERSALRHHKAGEIVLDALVQQLATVKAGRVLSKANEEKLRAAHAAIGEVLAQVEGDDPEDAGKGMKPDLEAPAEAAFMPCDGCLDADACRMAGECMSEKQKAARLRTVAARLRIAGIAAA